MCVDMYKSLHRLVAPSSPDNRRLTHTHKHTCKQSFDNLEHWRTDFLHNASPPDPDNFPFLVLGNKADLESDRKVAKQKAVQWTKSKGPKAIPYFETSAKDATRVEAAFLEAAQLALAQTKNEKDE